MPEWIKIPLSHNFSASNFDKVEVSKYVMSIFVAFLEYMNFSKPNMHIL